LREFQARFLLVTIAGPANAAGSYEISWYTIDSGGRTSSGGLYVLTGTVGWPKPTVANQP